MVKLFCPKCYHGNEYSSSPPRFCGQCGASFSNSASSLPVTAEESKPIRTPKTLKSRPPVEEEDDVEDNETPTEIPESIEIKLESVEGYRPRTERIEINSRGNQNSLIHTVAAGKKGKSPSKKTIKKNWEQMFPKQRKSTSLGPEE